MHYFQVKRRGNDASCSASEVTGCQRAQGAPRLEVACRAASLGSESREGGIKSYPTYATATLLRRWYTTMLLTLTRHKKGPIEGKDGEP